MESREFIALLEKYSRGECNPAEEKLIQDWYENIGMKHEHEEPPHADIEANLWSKINPRQGENAPDNRWYSLKMAIAIVFVALTGIALFVYWNKAAFVHDMVAREGEEAPANDNYAIITNEGSGSKSVTLGDGSQVTLKTHSEIRFVKEFQAEQREVYLTGEAFFVVRRDELRPFIVYSNEVITKVLGTSFNIKAYKDDKEITVAVKTGKVSVYKKSGQESGSADREVILTPNHQVVINKENDKVSRELVDNPEVLVPTPTLFKMKYDGTPVTEIFEALEQNYGVDISYDEDILTGCVLTTTMVDEGLYERIEVICKAINAEYTINNAVIVIKSHGCL